MGSDSQGLELISRNFNNTYPAKIEESVIGAAQRNDMVKVGEVAVLPAPQNAKDWLCPGPSVNMKVSFFCSYSDLFAHKSR